MSNTTTTILKNSLFLYLRMFLLLLVSLYTSRIVLKYLGVTDFGIYNVVGGIISFVVFFNNTLLSATQRFINYALGDKEGNVTVVFKTSMIMHAFLCILLIILMYTIGLWFLNNKIVLPPNRLYAAQWAFHTSVVIGVLSIIKTPFNAIIIAHERMDTFAYISIVEALLKLIVAYLLSTAANDTLILYSILMCLVQLAVFLMYYFYVIKNFQDEISYRCKINSQLLKDFLKFIGWSSYGGISMLGYTQGLNMLLNVFFGPVQNAARGIAVQVESVVNQFRGNFQIAVNPQLVKSYAEDNMTYFFKLMSFGCKFSTFIMLSMIVPLCFRLDWLLKLWLVDVPENTVIFIKILLIGSLIDSPSAPFVIGIQANGNIKWHEIINGTLLLLILPISYYVLSIGFPPFSIFIVYAFFMFVALVIRITIFSKLMKIGVTMIFNQIFKRIIIVCCLSFLLGCFFNEFIQDTIWGSLLYSILTFFIIVALSYFIGLSSNEKEYATSIILKLVNKIKQQ